MPRMDGFEVVARIKNDPKLAEIPIIMITSRTGDKHRDRALGLGANGYLGKPYQEAVLFEAINEVIPLAIYLMNNLARKLIRSVDQSLC